MARFPLQAICLALIFLTACAPTGTRDREKPRSSPEVDPPPITSAPLDDGAVLERIAFGSCYVPQYDTPEIWNVVAETDPDLFLLLGDNVYQSEENSRPELLELREAYDLLARDKPFAELRATTPLLVTWDDHDYGLNNAGGEFPAKHQSEKLFEHVWDVRPGDPRRERDGVYHARIVGPEGKRVQLIVLDTRFFRSVFTEDKDGKPVPDPNPAKSMLGDAQWRWLEEQLRLPAEIRIIASSVQVLTEGHRGESWRMLPNERRRLLNLIATTKAAGVVFVSGDRHLGAHYRNEDDGPYALTELTSSSLNLPISAERAASWSEPDPRRVGELYFGTNFGILLIDWDRGTIRAELRGLDGDTASSSEIAFAQLQPTGDRPTAPPERSELIDPVEARIVCNALGLPVELGSIRETAARRAQERLSNGGLPATIADGAANFSMRVSAQPAELEGSRGYMVETWIGLTELTEVTRFPEGHPDRYHRVELWSSAIHDVATGKDLERIILDNFDKLTLAFLGDLEEARARDREAEGAHGRGEVHQGATPIEVVEALIQAFNAHDVEEMVALVADDVEWLSVQNATISVETRGKAALRQGMTDYFKNIPSARSTIEGTMASGSYVTVRERAHWRGKNGDARSQAALAVYEVRDGRVARVWYFPAE